jgi:hypothetical protein
MISPPSTSPPPNAFTRREELSGDRYPTSDDEHSVDKQVLYIQIRELLTTWACIKNISATAFDHLLFGAAIQLLSNSEFHYIGFSANGEHLDPGLKRDIQSQAILSPQATMMIHQSK